jgi:peptidoglycan DL-endopeptidase CwlO
MPGARVSGIAAGAIGAGVLLTYAGITGKDIPAAVKAVISGKSPATGPQKYPITSTGQLTPAGGISGAGATASGSAIAAEAIQFQGHCYVYGGAPGPDGTGCWDCSSFVSWVLTRLGMAIPPGSNWNGGTGHGPSSWSYLSWAGAATIGHAGSAAAAGDLCIFTSMPGHIGIALGGGQMISALDPSQGTTITGIDGTAGGALFIRRLKAAA